VAQLYNVALTEAQILQNFEADRSRFGVWKTQWILTIIITIIGKRLYKYIKLWQHFSQI
jgi:hypothetical protein